MFSNDGYKDGEIERLTRLTISQKAIIEDLESSITRRDSTNGELMDQMRCRELEVEGLEEEVRQYQQGNDECRMARLDLSRALDSKEAELSRAYERIGILETRPDLPGDEEKLVVTLAAYVKEQIELHLEARDYD